MLLRVCPPLVFSSSSFSFFFPHVFLLSLLFFFFISLLNILHSTFPLFLAVFFSFQPLKKNKKKKIGKFTSAGGFATEMERALGRVIDAGERRVTMVTKQAPDPENPPPTLQLLGTLLRE